MKIAVIRTLLLWEFMFEMTSVMKKLIATIILLVLLGAILTGCSPSAVPQVTPTTQITHTPAAPLATEPPAATPTPQATKILLVASEEMNLQGLQALLTELGGKSGLTLETRPEIHKADLSPQIKMVVLLAPPADLSELLSSAPQTQFVVVSAVDLADLSGAKNITVIRKPAEKQAFLAGFISVLLSTDFRAAGLLPNDGPLGASLKDAFSNGGHYYCGVCAPGWPLRVYYPVLPDLPSASDGTAWQAAAVDMFDNQKADVFYLSADAARQEVFDYVQGKTQAGKTVLLLGEQTPPDALRPQWAATVRYDISPVLSQIWPDITANKSGGVLEAPLVVEEVNSDLLGEGRMRLINELIENVKTGAVYPLSVPLE